MIHTFGYHVQAGAAARDCAWRAELLPDLQPIAVRAPQPPMLDPALSEQERVEFLVRAYGSFAGAHLPAAAWDVQRVRALAARGDSRTGLPLRRKLLAAAAVMCGEAWGELGEVIRAGKLPERVAPHSFLLWSAQAALGGPGRRGRHLPGIEHLFSPRRLLSSEGLRVYTHASADLAAGATRAGATWAEREGIGKAHAALQARRLAVAGFGANDRASATAAIARVGACLAGQDLRALDEAERERAKGVERKLAELAATGIWVWGRWFTEGDLR